MNTTLFYILIIARMSPKNCVVEVPPSERDPQRAPSSPTLETTCWQHNRYWTMPGNASGRLNTKETPLEQDHLKLQLHAQNHPHSSSSAHDNSVRGNDCTNYTHPAYAEQLTLTISNL